MATYDPRKSERLSDKRRQIRTAGQDVDMIDAPEREPSGALKGSPRKLEVRSGQGGGEIRQSIRRNDERTRSATAYGYSRSSYTTHETRRRSQSVSSKQDLQASIVPGKGTTGRYARDSDDDEDYRRYIRERKRRFDAEDKVKAMNESYQSLVYDRDAETERRARAERALLERDSRLTIALNEIAQLKEFYGNELQKRDVDFMEAREQSQLREEQWKAEIGQKDSERQRRDIEVQQWKLERQQSETERQEWEVERRQWESQAKEYDADLKGIMARWKQTAKELNGLRAQGRGFYQVTDNYLGGLITQLRYKVRDFGIQYFSEKLPKRPKFEPNRVWKENMVPTTRDESYLDLVNCSETRPSVIQAFMWRVIVQEVFCKFRWAGSASLPVTQLCKDLESCLNGGSLSPADIEATKKFHAWRATTVGLFLDSMDQQKRRQADIELQKWMSEVHDEAHVNLRLLRPKDQKDCQQDFFDIIDEAVKIDKEISRQVSRVTWTFSSELGIPTLDLASMELRKGEVFKPKSKVTLVTSPGVIKQGKSTGEGFESSIDLLKMEVSCETAASWQ